MKKKEREGERMGGREGETEQCHWKSERSIHINCPDSRLWDIGNRNGEERFSYNRHNMFEELLIYSSKCFHQNLDI